MLRQEAIAILKELSNRNLVQPLGVIIESRALGRFQLKIRDAVDCKQIEWYLKDKGLFCEEKKNYLIIFKP